MKNFNSQEEFINRIKNKVNTNRIPLAGEKFNIISMLGEVKYEVKVDKLIGAGGSALVYDVCVDDNYPPVKRMIMKEFYPNYNENMIKASRNPLSQLELNFEFLEPEAEERFRKDRDKFMDAYNKHIRILDMDTNLHGKIVRPYRLEIDNSYLYALYEVDTANSVDKYYNLDLARIIEIIKQTADILIHLHKNDIIYMDLKPANILYNYSGNEVKLFDFDAAIDLRELDYVNEFYMPSEKAFVPPELRYITDISHRKELFISEEVDLYMLGVTFFYLLMGRYPIERENEDMDFLARNVREVLNKKSMKILLNSKATEKIIELIQESISIHRFISVSDFKNKLIEIQQNLKFIDDVEFYNILSTAHFLNYHPLYNYIRQEGDSKYIDVAIVGNNNISRTFFSFIFSLANLEGVDLRITLYDNNPSKYYQEMLSENPLLAQTTNISVKGRVKNKKINKDITNKPYAYINFDLATDAIDQSYILILDKTGYEYPDLANNLYGKYKDDRQARVILNYSINNQEVDIREEENILFYNLSLLSAASLSDRNYSEMLLDQAFEYYRINIMNYVGERVDFDSIWQGFLREDFYNLKACLRAVLSINYKLYMAGIDENSDIAAIYYNKVLTKDKDLPFVTLRDILADYEHHTWNRFMIAQGYRVPTTEELYSYAYIDEKNYADYQNKLHPFICNTDLNLVKSGHMDKLAEVSYEIDQLIREKTIHKGQQIQYRMLNILHNTLWEDNKYLKKLKPLWEQLVRLAYKIIENEFYANNSLNVLTYEIEQVLNAAKPDLRVLSTDYYQIKNDLNLLVQRNRSIAFRESEYLLIDFIPLIISEKIRTIYKPFIADDKNLWANIIATIKFYPDNLIFLTDEPIDHNRMFRIRSFLENKRLQKSINIEVISYDQLKYYSKENAIVDFTLNSHSDAMRPEFKDLEYVEYRGFNDWVGNYEALDYYMSKRSLTVEETFFLNNAKVVDKKSLTNITTFIDYYPRIWELYLKLDSNDWEDFVKAIAYNQHYYKLDLDDYKRCDKHSLIEVGNFKFRKDDYLKYRNLNKLLDDLVKEDLIIDYKFPLNPGRLKIHSYNDDLSKDIGSYISENMWQYNEDFKLLKTEIEENNYNYSYAIVTDKFSFSYDYETQNPNEFAKKTNQIMIDIDKGYAADYSRVFNHIDDLSYIKAIDNKKIALNYELGGIVFRDFFASQGNILKLYTYFELIKYADFFDEIKINVNLRWKAYDDYSEDSLAIETLLDIVCTKGFSTFIISTIKDNIKDEDLYEINNHIKQFGIDAKPILMASNSNDDTSKIKKIAAAAGVYFIDRQMLENNKLVDYIKNISSGKKDWQVI